MRTTSLLGAILLYTVGLLLVGCGPEDLDAEAVDSPLAAWLTPQAGAALIADPYRAQFPTNCVADNFARSIWDMQAYEGRIYVGAGDYWNNRGNVAVWSIGDDGTTADSKVELVVDDEMVDRFVTSGDTLYIPGKDATESWDYGNYYSKRAGVWTKHRTIPNGVHVLDLAVFSGSLFVNMRDAQRGAVRRSTDAGATWTAISSHEVAGMLAPTATELLIFGDGNQLWGYSAQGVKEYRGTKLAPRTATAAPSRLTPFGAGVLYVATLLPMFDSPSPLLYLAKPYTGYVALNKLAGETVTNVRDVRVDGGIAYVLAAKRDTTSAQPAYVGQIFSSADAKTWRKDAEFTVPAPPYSLARLNGRFYVGLGNDGWFVTDTTPEPASGTIWRID